MKAKLDIEELMRERVYPLDRDTILLYLGHTPKDLRPFVRIGAGRMVPESLLPFIESVILPENEIWNLGLESGWLDAALAQGVDHIRYVGSRDRVNQINNYFDIPVKDHEQSPVQLLSYQMQKGKNPPKDRCLVEYFETGNFSVTVNGTRAFDLQASTRGKITIDREFELVTKALSKREKKCTAGLGFVYPGANPGSLLSIYWNFNGSGVYQNPIVDYHERLFENTIEPESVVAALSSSTMSPGLNAVLRRKNVTTKPLSVYAMDSDRLNILKRLYQKLNMKALADSSSVPGGQGASFFTSKSGSHGAYSIKMGSDAEKQVLILFPIGGTKKSSRGFDFLKGPFDLEIAKIDELPEDRNAHLILHTSGNRKPQIYGKTKLNAKTFPLLPTVEYKYVYSEKVAQALPTFIQSIEGTPFAETIRGLFFTALGVEPPENFQTYLDALESSVPPTSVVIRNNVSQCLRFLVSAKELKIPDMDRKLIDKIQKKFSIERNTVTDWMALSTQSVFINLLFFDLKDTFLLVQKGVTNPVNFAFVPTVDDLEKDPKAYRQSLKQWGRAIDKAGEPAGYRQCLELLERIYEERLTYFEPRKKFKVLLDYLGLMAKKTEAQTLRGWPKPIRDFLRAIGLDKFIEKLSGSGESVSNGIAKGAKAALLLIGLGALVTLGVWGIRSISLPRIATSITESGNSEAEQAAVNFRPGDTLQADVVVPGEEDVVASDREIFLYADALARRNGFTGIDRQGTGALRDPDRVFPGDRIRLPDGRLVAVQPGITIWKVATVQYKKDFARLTILNRQLVSLRSDFEKKKMPV